MTTKKYTSPSKNGMTAEPITHVPILKNCNSTPNGPSPIRNDGTFIEYTDLHDGFASINTVRYGEEVDVDDF
ncbi:MAG: hypothetical protein RSD26_07825 [Cellulosilyticaceae bacterium]|uniref:hypothetical protein n=1 Tax=Niameybacter sp. TaxID=2033640 RepID=UPI002FC610E6